MNKHILSHLSRSLMVLLLMLGLAFADNSPRLQQIKHTILSPASEQITLQLNGSYSPKVFTLKGQSPRVVFDFVDMTQARDVRNVLEMNGPLLKAVRVGRHSDPSPKTRVVFDLKTLKGVKYTQQFDATTSTLTIRFTGPQKAVAKTKPTGEQPPAQTQVRGKEQPTPKTTPGQANLPAPSQVMDKTIVSKTSELPPIKAKLDTAQGVVTTPAVAQSSEPPAAAKPDPQPVQPPQKAASTETVKAAAIDQSPEKKEEAKNNTAKAQAAAVKEEKTKPVEPAAKGAESKEPPPVVATEPSPEPEIVAAPVSRDPVLESVKFDPSSPKGEMVMFKLNGFFPPSVHGVEEGIPRVICDFNNTKLAGNNKKRIKTEGKFVKAIRISKTKKPEKVRVVIDLEPNRSYDLQQVFFKDDNLFVIIVNTIKK
ncbi:MAG: AMIN domain-containing protein [Desulfobulbus sp.]